jgi:tetratricopeptide (TPR) repeat protein
MRKTAVLLILGGILALGGMSIWRYIDAPETGRLPNELRPFDLDERPQSGRYLFDYAAVLTHYEEGVHRYLENIASRFGIEALVVSIPALPQGYSIQTLAVDMVNNWDIGREQDGRGLLLLLVEDSKQVKLEVGYELEDVFTDAFSGYVEDLQLGPYYRSGDVGTGMIALMEMLEQRAQTKHLGEYTSVQIARADAELLAGGAGAMRNLGRYEQQRADQGASQGSGQGARSPEEAWEIMLAKWSGDGKAIPVDIYTRMTRLAMGDPNNPDPRALNSLDHWRNAEYQILNDGDYAVIWFGAIDGWDNAPFLFCNDGDGWKFDIVHQRRLIVMAQAPKWQVSQGPYPYVARMYKARQSTGKDLPLKRGDLYRCSDDRAIADRMAVLKRKLAESRGDIEAVIELMRLEVITGQRPARIRPLLEQVRKLAPERPELYKYSAIFNVNGFFQYETALKDIERYIELQSGDAFGYEVQGFLLYRLGRYEDSIEALEMAVTLDDNSGYAYALMARDYVMLYRRADNLRKNRYREKAMSMLRKAENVTVTDSQRLKWLRSWMKRRLN